MRVIPWLINGVLYLRSLRGVHTHESCPVWREWLEDLGPESTPTEGTMVSLKKLLSKHLEPTTCLRPFGILLAAFCLVRPLFAAPCPDLGAGAAGSAFLQLPSSSGHGPGSARGNRAERWKREGARSGATGFGEGFSKLQVQNANEKWLFPLASL